MNTDKFVITTVQADLIWENSQSNLIRFEALLSSVQHTDLIVLPEMFTTGFSMKHKELAEEMGERSVKWMMDLAKKKNSAIIGSLIVKEDELFYNRLFFVHPDGSFQTYDKRHLFQMGGENQYFSRGSDRLVVSYKGWKICPLICYDLRFPVWSRNDEDYDLLIYIANWPMSRREVWQTLLNARAIENQSYVVGVNRVGKDGAGIVYSGDSRIIDAKGQIITQSRMMEESVISTDVSLSQLHQFREQFPILNDQDSFLVMP